MDLTVVILAAGKGTRMRSNLPKVLHAIGGKSMLSRVIQTAKSLSPKKIIVIYGEHKAQMAAQISDPDLVWVQQVEQNGTGDAVRVALEQIGTDHRVLTLYGDVPLIESETLLRLMRVTSEESVGLLTAQVDDPTGLGRILRNEKGEIEGIREEKDASDLERQIHEINTGIFLVPSNYLHSWLPQLNNDNANQEYYLTDIIGLASSQKVAVQTASPLVVNEIQGINNRAQLIAAERFFQKQQADKYLDQGVLILDPNRFDLRGYLTAGIDVTIDINVILEGQVTLGHRTQIGAHSYLKNCEIGQDVQILSHCHLEGAVISDGATVGPFARLRPGTKLGEDTRVGNFVEIKNSVIGSTSKVNHLSYIGDATIGRQVNIGAGTITCNYDGAQKHQTVIKDGVLIGSNCQLVAPVTVEAGATLAAGSTLTKDAPANQLTLTHRLEPRSLDWQRPTKNIESQASPIIEP